MRVGELMDLPTDAEKRRRAGRIVATHLNALDALGRSGAPKELLDLMQLEVDGGSCPRCGRPWKEVRYDNAFGCGRYFRPACRCYKRCAHCGYECYRQEVMGQLECTVSAGRYVIQGRAQKIPASRVLRCPNCGVIFIVLHAVEERDERADGEAQRYQRSRGKA